MNPSIWKIVALKKPVLELYFSQTLQVVQLDQFVDLNRLEMEFLIVYLMVGSRANIKHLIKFCNHKTFLLRPCLNKVSLLSRMASAAPLNKVQTMS